MKYELRSGCYYGGSLLFGVTFVVFSRTSFFFFGIIAFLCEFQTNACADNGEGTRVGHGALGGITREVMIVPFRRCRSHGDAQARQNIPCFYGKRNLKPFLRISL